MSYPKRAPVSCAPVPEIPILRITCLFDRAINARSLTPTMFSSERVRCVLSKFFLFFLFLFLKMRKGEQVLPGINRTRLSVLINSRVNGVKVRQKENKSFFFKRIFRIYREWKDTNFSFNFIYGSILKLVFFYSKWIYISFSLIMNEEMIHRFLICVRNFGSYFSRKTKNLFLLSIWSNNKTINNKNVM